MDDGSIIGIDRFLGGIVSLADVLSPFFRFFLSLSLSSGYFRISYPKSFQIFRNSWRFVEGFSDFDIFGILFGILGAILGFFSRILF